MNDSSIRQLAFKTQLFANNIQRAYFAKASGVSRFCWNWGVYQWNKQYQAHCVNPCLPKPNGKALKKQLNAIKKDEFPWMYEVTKYAAQQPFIFLDRAYKDWIEDLSSSKPKHLKKSRPTFKKKGKCLDSFYVGGDQVRVIGDKVKVPNLGWVTMAEPIKFDGHIHSMTISRQADKWYVSFSIADDLPVLPSKNQAACGVDLGIKTLATLSNGGITHWHTPKPLKHALTKLKRYQRHLARKIKGSSGYQKQKQKIARLHKRIADIRLNTLHQLTKYLSKHFSKVVIEDLNIRGMMQNRKLARSIADVGMFEFRRQLSYKLAWKGGKLIVADRWFASSKLCSKCRKKNEHLKLSDRIFHCVYCNHSQDRDENASVNLEYYEQFYTGRSPGINAVGDDGSALLV
ncbi:RNA-guided endonuclease InsQ/TnpB family protein [Oleiphilus messinensis]|nr:RNA-guided endonuclease TnpB family protein [Oleiphilus messinensis]